MYLRRVPSLGRSRLDRVARVLLLLLVGCSHPDPVLVPQLDLIEAFRYTQAACAHGRVDLGTPDGDRARVAGWAAEALGDDALAWVAERRAELRICVDQPGERRLRIRARAMPVDGRRRQGAAPVVVRLNHQRLGVIRVGEEMHTFELAIPSRAQRRGENLLELEHPMLMARGRLASSTLPEGSVGYDWLELDAGDRERPASLATVDGDALLLPAGARVEYFVRAPADARVRFAVAAGGGGAARLRVVARRDGELPRTLAELQPEGAAARQHELPLGGEAGQVVSLSLVADGSGALRVVAPRIVGAPAPEVPAGAAPPDEPARAARPPNVVLYVIDTLRADHLGCYGYDLPTSPRIDALARQGILFERVVAQSSWTRPAVASLLTGLDPYEHGAIGLRQALPANVPTLATMLAARGYATAAFVTNVNVSAPFGFARGFATFVYLREEASRESLHVLSDELNRAARPWLAARDERPFFLYLHASDPHAPYTAAPELRARFRRGGDASALEPGELRRKLEQDAPALTDAEVGELVAAYDAEVAFNDASLGVLLDELERLGLRESTLVIVTGDHGEEFRDHGGFQHGHTLYDELIHVPLIVRLPDGARAGERHRGLARQIDLVPSILTRLGFAIPSGLPGRPLLEQHDDDPPDLLANSHTRLSRRDIAAVVGRSWKVVRQLGAPSESAQAFDLAADPAEQHDVAPERPILTGYATQAIRRAASATPPRSEQAPAPLDAETELRLRALGYAE